MAEDTVKRLLIRLGVNSDELDAAIKRIKNQLDELFRVEQQRAQQASSSASSAATTLKQRQDLEQQVAQTIDSRAKKEQAEQTIVKEYFEQGSGEIDRLKQEIDLRQSLLNMMEAEERVAGQAYATLEKELEADRQRLLIRQEILKTSTGQRARPIPTGTVSAEVTTSARDTVGVSNIQSRVQQAVSQATQSSPITEEQLQIERQIIAELKAELDVRQQALKVMSTESGINKEDVLAVQSKIASQRAYLQLLHAELNVHTQTFKKQQDDQRKQAAKTAAPPVPIEDLSKAVDQATKLLTLTKEEVAEKREELNIEQRELQLKAAYIDILARQQNVRREDIAVLKQELAGEQAVLTLKQRQLSLAAAQVGPEAEGFFGKIKEGLSEALKEVMGKNLFSQVAGGVFTGFIATDIFTGIIEQVHKLGEALFEASGRAQDLQKQFRALAEQRGEGPEELIEKLRKSTAGLVSDTQLFEVASRFMRQNMRASTDQISQLIGTTVKLAQATGSDVPTAIGALERAAATGQARMLAFATGLNVNDLRIRQLGSTVGNTTKNTVQFNMVLNAELEALRKIGEPATSLPELFRQMQVAQANFIDSIVEGILHVGKYGSTIQELSERINAFMPRLLEIGKGIGESLGNAITFVIDHVGELKTALEVLMALKVADWAISTASYIAEIGQAASGTSKAVRTLSDIFPVLDKVKTIGTGLRAGPLGIAIAVGGALYAAAKLNNLSFGDAVQGLKEVYANIADLASIITESVKNAIKSVASIFIPGWQEAWDALVPIVERAFKSIESLAKDHAGTIRTILSALFPPAMFFNQLKKLSDEAKSREQIQGSVARGDVGKAKGRTAPETPEEYRKRISEGVGAAPVDITQKSGLAQKEEQLDEFDLEKEMEVQKKLADLKLKIIDETLKAKLQKVQIELDEEAALEKMRYEEGETTIEQYTNAQMALAQRRHDAAVSQAKQEAAAEKEKIRVENNALIDQITKQQQILDAKKRIASTPEEKASITMQQVGLENEKVALEDPRIVAQQGVLIEQQKNTKIIAADAQLAKEQRALRETMFLDEKKAASTYQEEIIKVEKSGVDEQTKLLEQHFKDGEVAAETYLNSRRSLLDQEHTLVLRELDNQLADSTKSEQEKAAIYVKRIDEEIAYEKQLTELVDQEDGIRLQAAENYYGKVHSLLTAQQDIAAAQVSVGQPGAEVQQAQATEEIISLNETQLAQLKQMFSQVEVGSKEWFQIAKDIGTITTEQAQLNRQLAQMKDYLTPIANLFQVIDRLTGSTQSGLGAWLRQASQMLQVLGQFRQQIQVQGGAAQSVRGIFQSAQNVFNDVFHPERQRTSGPRLRPLPTLSPKEKAEKEAADRITSTSTKISNSFKDTDASVTSFRGQIETTIQTLQDFVAKARAAMEKLNAPVGQKKQGSEGSGDGQAPWETGEAPSPFDLPEGSFGDQPDVSGGDSSSNPFGDLQTQSDGLAESFGAFIKQIQGWVQAIGSVVQSITSAQTGASGAMSGIMGGAQLGGMIPGLGIFGTIIGGAVGGVLGAITGQKNEQYRELADSFKNRMQAIENSMKAGTTSLGTAIAQLQQERQEILNEMSGGKKKEQKQLKPVLEALNSELFNLQTQQKQVLENLHEQVAILSSPTAFQPFLDQLDQVMQKYQEFASAADGNTQEMAAANQYLALSLQQYASTLGEQLNQAQQSAVQDALKLIDLEQERLNLLQQEQETEYGILTQGVLVRQQTQAQQKGAQIEQLHQQLNTQLQQIDEETALQQHKVDAEQKVFNLAQDRIGLESQLLALQEQQADKDVANFQALTQVYQNLAGLISGATLPSGLLNSTGPINIGILQGLLGLPNTYNPYALPPSSLIPGATGQIPGSPNYVPRGTPLANLPANPGAGLPNTVPSLDVGGSIQRTGLVTVHEGEKVVPAQVVRNATDTRTQLPGVIGKFTNSWFGDVISSITQASQGTDITGRPIANPILNGNPITSVWGGTRPVANPITAGPWTSLINSVQAQNQIPDSAVPPPVGLGAWLGDGWTKLMKAAIAKKQAEQGQTTPPDRTAVTSPIMPQIATETPLMSNISGQLGSMVDAHAEVNSLAMHRLGMEQDLTAAYSQRYQMEMDRMDAMSSLLDKMANTVGGNAVTSFEGGLQKVYELRGRYGAGGFRRQTP